MTAPKSTAYPATATITATVTPTVTADHRTTVLAMRPDGRPKGKDPS
jgi:hypothetical protein